jgi:hypothetical protein
VAKKVIGPFPNLAVHRSAKPLLYNFCGMKRLREFSRSSGFCWERRTGLRPSRLLRLQPTNYVNDFAGVLDAPTQARLNDLCHQVEQKAQAQIAVVTVKSLDGQDVVSYAVALYQKWGIGRKGRIAGC